MLIFLKTADKLMELIPKLVWNTLQNLGVLVEPYLVFQELVVLELQEQDKLLSVTWLERDVCLSHLKLTEDGIEKLISNKEDMPLLPL
jgi:hypothetical protein